MSDERPLIMITGGGTGGHVYPALAIAEGLRPWAEVVYVGDARKLEARVVPQRGWPFVGLVTQPFPRRGGLPLVGFLTRLAWNVARCLKLLHHYRPRLVIGVGGYVSAPLIIAAGMRHIPVVLHEQNVRPGTANLKLQRYASLILLSYEGARNYFQATCPIILTGCPVDPHLKEVSRAEARERLGLESTGQVVLVVGGSGGAEALNRAVVEMLPQLALKPTDLFIYHITGPRYFDAVTRQIAELRLPEEIERFYRAVPYSDEIQYPYAAADLIVCRAGSATLSEIMALGLPAILVPSPNVTDNHQEINARELANHGAAEVLLEAELNGKTLLEAISRLCAEASRLAQMKAASRALAREDAQAEIVRALMPFLERISR